MSWIIKSLLFIIGELGLDWGMKPLGKPRGCHKIHGMKRRHDEMKRKISINSIESAALLSKEEYNKYRDKISHITKNWWLRSAGRSGSQAAFVSRGSGIVDGRGINVHLEFGVRPALQISNSVSMNLESGDTFEFGRNTFTYLGEGLALCDNIVGNCVFRKDWNAPDANVYETSDVKKYVEDWFEKTKEKGITITISPELERRIVAFCDDELYYHIHESGCAEEYRSEIETQIELLRLLGHEDTANKYENEFTEELKTEFADELEE